MTNRLIGLLIILTFILLGLGYYFLVEKNPTNLKENSKNILKTKIIKKKISLKKIENKKSLLSLSDEENKILETRKTNKIKENIQNILKLNNKINIKIKKIDGNKNLFLIYLEENKLNNSIKNYIYNKKKLNLEKLDLNIKIKYIKCIDNEFYIITKKGLFIKKNKKLEYFPTFSDFVIKDGNYIGIIKDSDKTRKNNFNYSNLSGNLIILYNPKKSIKKILYKPNFEINKILIENKQIIIINNNDEKFLLNF